MQGLPPTHEGRALHGEAGYLAFCPPVLPDSSSSVDLRAMLIMWQHLSPPAARPSECCGLTHLPRGRTLIRFCTSSSLSESLVSATAWLWEARGEEGQGGLGPCLPSQPLHINAAPCPPLTSGSSGSSGWAEPSAGACTLGRGHHIPCGGR